MHRSPADERCWRALLRGAKPCSRFSTCYSSTSRLSACTSVFRLRCTAESRVKALTSLLTLSTCSSVRHRVITEVRKARTLSSVRMAPCSFWMSAAAAAAVEVSASTFATRPPSRNSRNKGVTSSTNRIDWANRGRASSMACVAASAAANTLSNPSDSACRARRVMIYTRSSSATPGWPLILPFSHTMLPSSAHSGWCGPALHTGNGICGVISSSGSAMSPDWLASTTLLRGTTVLVSFTSHSTSTRDRLDLTLSTEPTCTPRILRGVPTVTPHANGSSTVIRYGWPVLIAVPAAQLKSATAKPMPTITNKPTPPSERLLRPSPKSCNDLKVALRKLLAFLAGSSAAVEAVPGAGLLVLVSPWLGEAGTKAALLLVRLEGSATNTGECDDAESPDWLAMSLVMCHVWRTSCC
mmetsp:Transcript_15119/g.26253  ORF Transcript_15119/g.26253 Transcript_15119/m.26253 type:complete len:412 (-) Transcript_15119:268-1503(-)